VPQSHASAWEQQTSGSYQEVKVWLVSCACYFLLADGVTTSLWGQKHLSFKGSPVQVTGSKNKTKKLQKTQYS